MRYAKTETGLLVPDTKLRVGGVFHGAIIRKGRVVDEFSVANIVTNQGLDYLLGAAFGTVAALTSWYLAPFANNYTPVGSDTAASIVANAGEANNYTGTTRAAYAAVEAGQQVTNGASPANFTFTTGGNIYGAFLSSSPGQTSTAGVLMAAAQFGGVKAVQPQDQLLLSYIFSAASA